MTDCTMGRSSTAGSLPNPGLRFAILLSTVGPNKSQTNILGDITTLARSLHATTARGRTDHSAPCYSARIYLALDHNHDFTSPLSLDIGKHTEQNLCLNVLFNFTIVNNTHSRTNTACNVLADCATRASKDLCDYYVLLGDSVEFLDDNWMAAVDSQFAAIADSLGCLKGFGCVTLIDMASPRASIATVVHKTHLEIFGGEIIVPGFVTQDIDIYTAELYRHFGASKSIHSPARNTNSWNSNAKTQRRDWAFELLEAGKSMVTSWTKQHAPTIQTKPSLDIIVPSYRVRLDILRHIFDLTPSNTCATRFMIIVDNPCSPSIPELQQKYGHRTDVRILINETNLGASMSRNRGLTESCAEWVAFLDDDVIPATDYLIEAERAIRARPNAAGFVGNTYFPAAPDIFTTAIHLGGMTYFWNIADRIKEDVPWGVTANLIARRNIRDDVEFSLAFPKTGGGEDIDFCRRKRDASTNRGGVGLVAAPKVVVVHPWWDGGRRVYWRFLRWGCGDGALIKMHPKLAWRDWSPNSAETLLLTPVLILSGAGLGYFGRGELLRTAGTVLPLNIILVNILYDVYRHCIYDKESARSFQTSVGRVGWGIAVCEGALVRMTNEMGRLTGILRRGEWSSVGKRFDWFAGGPGAIIPERNGNLQRCSLVIILTASMLAYFHS